MKFLLKYQVFVFALLFFLLPVTLEPQTGLYVPELARVDSVVSEFIAQWDVPGASIAIVKDSRLVYARGFGYADSAAGELVEPYHLFRLASISKPITAVAIMKLWDEDLINLEDTVFGPNGILNSDTYSNIKDSRAYDITVRHLLEHSGGWDRSISPDPMFQSEHIADLMGVDPPADPVTIIQYMLRSNLDFDPGARYAYSNFGYCILGRVIEEITGLAYEHYVKAEVLDLVGAYEMRIGRTLYENRADDEAKYYDYPGASLARSVYGDGKSVPWPYGGFYIGAMDSHGGWIASATDLLRLLVAVDGSRTKPDILSPAAIYEMKTPSQVNSGYALGWCVTGGNLWHNGSLPGTSTIMVKRYDGVYWAVLMNTRPLDWWNFMVPMDNMMWAALDGITDWPEHDLFEPVSITEDEQLPQYFILHPNYPNPFNAITTIAFRVPRNQYVRLGVYDVLGREVVQLADEYMQPGRKSAVWNGKNSAGLEVPSGIYIARLATPEYSKSIKACPEFSEGCCY